MIPRAGGDLGAKGVYEYINANTVSFSGLLHTLSHGRGEASSGPLVLFMSKYEEKDISPFTLKSRIKITGLNPHEVVTVDKDSSSKFDLSKIVA